MLDPPWQKLTEEKYEVTSSVPEAAILVCSTTEPKLTLKVTLTSPAMREEADSDPSGSTHTHTKHTLNTH